MENNETSTNPTVDPTDAATKLAPEIFDAGRYRGSDDSLDPRSAAFLIDELSDRSTNYMHNKKVKQCYGGCPFHRTTGHVMNCAHPYFDDKDLNDRLIVKIQNSRGRVPDECPLRLGDIKITVRTSLEILF